MTLNLDGLIPGEGAAFVMLDAAQAVRAKETFSHENSF